ncbi:MAG: potassium/proton antiporter [Actinomycetota bacterium]
MSGCVNGDPLILAAALLLAGGVLLSKTSAKLGVPGLLLFLGLGMLAGSEGFFDIEFDNFDITAEFGTVALAFILFSGGLDTKFKRIRPVLAPGLTLASVGVLVSALTLGGLATLILPLDLAEAMLLGAVIASTDAAAVFSILGSRRVPLPRRLKSLLELESGSNDPMAVFLTFSIMTLITSDNPNPFLLGGSFIVQMGLGAIGGYVAARGLVLVLNRLRLDFDGLYPVLTFAFVLLLYEGLTFVGGSGFLATYVAGVTLADLSFLHRRSLLRFHDSLAWLFQIAVFVLLGLLVFPSDLRSVAGESIVVALLLIFVARPIAVFLSLLPFRYSWREMAFVSWVGLRGATPIILATFPVTKGIADADVVFNVVFFVVLTSVLLKGTTIPWLARRLNITAAAPESSTTTFDAAIAGLEGPDLHEVQLGEGCAAADASIVSLGLPAGVLIVLVRRAGDSFMPEGGTVLHSGDELLILADTAGWSEAGGLFATQS